MKNITQVYTESHDCNYSELKFQFTNKEAEQSLLRKLNEAGLLDDCMKSMIEPDIPDLEELIGKECTIAFDVKSAKDRHAYAIQAFGILTRIHQEIVKRNCPGYSTDHGGPSVVKWEGELSVRHFFPLLSPLPLPSDELAQAFLEKHRNLWTTFWEGMV